MTESEEIISNNIQSIQAVLSCLLEAIVIQNTGIQRTNKILRELIKLQEIRNEGE